MSDAPKLGPFSMSPPAKPMPDAPAGGDIAILDAAGNIIAECFVWVNEAQTVDALAHARLIVAAPDLLDGADLVNAECRALSSTSAAHIGKLLRAIEVLNQARAKATRNAA